MVTHGPSSASGGITACRRDPSARRASTIGDDAVEPETERRDDPFDEPHDAAGVEIELDRFEPAGALDVRPPGPVEHHLADRRVGEQRLERPEPGDLVGQLARADARTVPA